jgi:membrane protein DedA with SNARE-associated domain/membrane-associated phospholipid phosphatase
MTAIGILIGSGVIPVVSTFGFAILGAIAGDSASYFLGYYFNDKIHSMWPFRKYPNLLESGRSFFDHHGGKSVFIGRFLGPLRAVVPVVAGMMRMPNGRFLVANVTSAILWSFIYILPGVFIGLASTELDHESSKNFLKIILIGLVLAWAVIYLFMKATNIASKFLDAHTKILWHWSKSHPKLKKYAFMILNPDAPNSNIQLVFFLLSCCCLILFLATALATYLGLFNGLDQLVLEGSTRLHSSKLALLMTLISFLGNKFFLFYLVTVLFIYLSFVKGQLRLGLHFLSLYLTTAFTVLLIKHLAFSARPDVLAVIKSTSSFPSGHATLAVSVIGFMTLIISQPFTRAVRQSIILPMASLIGLVILSRVYLAAHWFSDILAALFLGLTILFAHLLSYDRKQTKNTLKAKDLIPITLLTIVTFVSYSYFNFQSSYENNRLKAQSEQKHTPFFKKKALAEFI